MFDALYGASV
jgi:hypothetical protein